MRVFLSWSGIKSRAIAEAFRDVLPNILQQVRPFFSVDDIAKGSYWQRALAEALRDIQFGIVFVTSDNVDHPWLHFEAAAISKMAEATRVAPLLFGIKPGDVRNPLTTVFQAAECSEAEIRRLVDSINQASPEDRRISDRRLQTAFDKNWPDLKDRLDLITPNFGKTDGSTDNLKITQSVQSSRYIGRPIVNIITVTNEGIAAEEGLKLFAIPPAGLSINEVSDKGVIDEGRVTWNLDKINAGQSRSVEIRGTGTALGIFRSFAGVLRSAALSSAQLEVIGVAAIQLEVANDPDPVKVGANTTYTIMVTNHGSAVGTSVEIVCTLPSEMKFVAAGGATKCTSSGSTVTFAVLPSLAPKARATWTITVNAIAEGNVRFTTTMRTAEMKGPPVMHTESTNIYQPVKSPRRTKTRSVRTQPLRKRR